MTLNPIQWQNDKGLKKILSYFYNQTSYLIDRKIERKGNNFDLNPFDTSDENLLGENQINTIRQVTSYRTAPGNALLLFYYT